MCIVRALAWRSGMIALAVICFSASAGVAQWLSLPLPGTPRTRDGKADLKAPPPRTRDGKPDLSGIWRVDDARYIQNLLPDTVDAPMLPWAADVYKHRVDTLGYERPGTVCMPHGVPDAMTVPALPFKIMQTPGATIVLFEEFHVYRQIHTDGRKLPVDPDPNWYGYSVGRWDGDTLVIETTGFMDEGWLDVRGSPLTSTGKIIERFRRRNVGTLELEVTIDDPKAYTKPFSANIRYRLVPDQQLIEFVCLDKDAAHYVPGEKK
jgi:hypothetical protein